MFLCIRALHSNFLHKCIEYQQGRQSGHRSGATDNGCYLNSRSLNFDKFRLLNSWNKVEKF